MFLASSPQTMRTPPSFQSTSFSISCFANAAKSYSSTPIAAVHIQHSLCSLLSQPQKVSTRTEYLDVFTLEHLTKMTLFSLAHCRHGPRSGPLRSSRILLPSSHANRKHDSGRQPDDNIYRYFGLKNQYWLQ